MPNREDDKLRVQQATDIVRLVGEQVSLRPKGKEFAGLCPFHDDKSPSMFVSPAKQIYKCFSCGAGGDVFSFVMNYHKMTFPEAIKHLAERAGIELTPWDGGRGQSEGPSEREIIREANERALGFFRTLLKHPEHGKIARDYVESRGINPQMQADFQVGVAPDLWDGLAQYVASKGWPTRGFIAAGLISPRKGSGYGEQGSGHATPDPRSPNPAPSDCYDRLRHRLIFPIFDAIGRPIAFGGRVLPGTTRDDASDAKYLNSPETKLFNKSATLYGLHLAKKPIIDSRTAVIVEGYTDVIACHQHGLRNVVATLGTSLTREHVTELRRYAEKVVVIFDADTAGQKAADRAVEVFLTGDLDVEVANLPGGLDPADLLAKDDGVAQWQAAMDSAQDALAYQLDRVRGQLDAAGTVTGRQKAAEAYIVKLAELGLTRTGSLRKAFVLQRLSGLLHLGENTINEMLRQHAPRPRPANLPTSEPKPRAQTTSGGGGRDPGSLSSSPPVPPYIDPDDDDPDIYIPPEEGGAESVENPAAGATMKAVDLAERQVIGALLRDNALFHRTLPDGRGFDEVLVPEDFSVPAHRRLFGLIHAALAEDKTLTLAAMLGDIASSQPPQVLHRWSTALTQADVEVEQGSLGKPDKLCELFDLAVVRLLAAQSDQDYRRKRANLREKLAATENDVTVMAAALNEARQSTSAPSPGRILRRQR